MLVIWLGEAYLLSPVRAAFLAVLSTLMLVWTAWTVAGPAGLITDSAILNAYLAYNATWIVHAWFSHKGSLITASLETLAVKLLPGNLRETWNSLIWLHSSLPPLHSLISLLSTLTSVFVLVHLGFKPVYSCCTCTCIASRIALRSFARPLVILGYTWAWLVLERPKDLRLSNDSEYGGGSHYYSAARIVAWLTGYPVEVGRWAAIVLCLTAYARHLIFEPISDDSFPPIEDFDIPLMELLDETDKKHRKTRNSCCNDDQAEYEKWLAANKANTALLDHSNGRE